MLPTSCLYDYVISHISLQVGKHLKTSFSSDTIPQHVSQQRIRRTAVTRVHEAVKAIALCHNVTPVYEVEGDPTSMTYQASSPDEVCTSPTLASTISHWRFLTI